MKASGSMTSSTGRALSHGLMVPVTRACTKTARKRVSEDSHLLMEVTTRDNSSRMKSADLVTTIGQMENHMQATGVRTKWTGRENLSGRTERCIEATSSTTSVKATELSSGPMDVSTSANGKQVSSTELARISVRRARRRRDSGQTEGKSNGWMTMITKNLVRIWKT